MGNSIDTIHREQIIHEKTGKMLTLRSSDPRGCDMPGPLQRPTHVLPTCNFRVLARDLAGESGG